MIKKTVDKDTTYIYPIKYTILHYKKYISVEEIQIWGN